MLKCRKCEEEKPEDAFAMRKDKGYRERVCKACRYKQAMNNPKRQEYVAKHKQTEKWLVSSRRGVVRRHGLSLEEYEEMLISQNSVCAVCKNPETRNLGGKVKHLSIDHNHETGRVRGLLCDSCNVALGRVKDSVDILYAMIAYLNESG